MAAVAADNAHIAEAALALIAVDYEVLEPVIDVRAAMQADAPLLHDNLLRTAAMGEVSANPSNVAAHMKFEKGDTAAGFAQADVIVEREFTTASVHQGYIEPHNATAHWRADGQINIWCSTQGAFVVRANTADALRVDVSNVRVTPMEIGGGFGGKVTFYLGAGGGAAVPPGRRAGESADEPHGGFRGQRPGAGQLDARQDGRQPGRQDYRRRN